MEAKTEEAASLVSDVSRLNTSITVKKIDLDIPF